MPDATCLHKQNFTGGMGIWFGGRGLKEALDSISSTATKRKEQEEETKRGREREGKGQREGGRERRGREGEGQREGEREKGRRKKKKSFIGTQPRLFVYLLRAAFLIQNKAKQLSQRTMVCKT